MLMVGWVCWRNYDGERERGSKEEGVRVDQDECLKKVKSYICMRPTTNNHHENNLRLSRKVCKVNPNSKTEGMNADRYHGSLLQTYIPRRNERQRNQSARVLHCLTNRLGSNPVTLHHSKSCV
jgi:hypothetical protein